MYIRVLLASIVVTVLNAPASRGQVVELGGGVGTGNHTNVPALQASVSYPMVRGFEVGASWHVLYGVPVIDELWDVNDGTSTVVALSASLGWRETLGPVSIKLEGLIGGSNATSRRIARFFYVDDQPFAYAWFGSGLAYGVASTARIAVTDPLSVGVRAGYTAQRVHASTSTATGSSGRAADLLMISNSWYVGLSVGYRFTSDSVDAWSRFAGSSSKDTTRDRWQIIATLASIHPFTSTRFNEFNPGIGVHWRSHSIGSTWFAEGGVYQYSEGDRAMYIGGGGMLPVFTEWVKAGLFVGALSLYDALGATITPALSPRVVIDTPWGSATTLFIPAGSSSAFGFSIGLPIG